MTHYWREAKSDRLISSAREIEDPTERLAFVDIALQPPHASAIRVWAAHDEAVQAIQIEADEERRALTADAFFAAGSATVGMYLLVG
ncbi:hypothetical protein [Rhodococcus olei]|uniref:hypothetical protein n=1 Tax=Rhodococcus olei TaxID=2161675 RepID=UPI0031EB7290